MRLAADEGLEDVIEVGSRNSGPAIADAELHGQWLHADSGCKRDRALSYRAIGHRVTRIHQQVENDLLHLDAVGHDVGKSAIEIDVYVDVARDELASAEAEHVVDARVQVDRFPDRLALVEQRAQPLDHLCGTQVFFDDVVKYFMQLPRRPSRVEQPQGRLGVAED